ncbi:hypothetical protein V6N13_101174 [Hibiscus sabdariffa]
MYDITEEFGYNVMFNMYWKQSGVKLIVNPLRTDSDVISMLGTMPTQKQLHVYLEEIVPETEGVDTTGAIPNERLEVEEEDDVGEDEDYVVDEVEQTDSDSGFEDNDNDMTDEIRVEEVNYETIMLEIEFVSMERKQKRMSHI